jgi:hypothetical protein
VIAVLGRFVHTRETASTANDATQASLTDILRRLEALERRLPS